MGKKNRDAPKQRIVIEWLNSEFPDRNVGLLIQNQIEHKFQEHFKKAKTAPRDTISSQTFILAYRLWKK